MERQGSSYLVVLSPPQDEGSWSADSSSLFLSGFVTLYICILVSFSVASPPALGILTQGPLFEFSCGETEPVCTCWPYRTIDAGEGRDGVDSKSMVSFSRKDFIISDIFAPAFALRSLSVIFAQEVDVVLRKIAQTCSL